MIRFKHNPLGLNLWAGKTTLVQSESKCDVVLDPIRRFTVAEEHRHPLIVAKYPEICTFKNHV